FLLSFFIAGTIAEPIRQLAEAAERVKRGTKARREIPDFTGRSDEIGHLSGALRDMTKALYDRIEAIERFAADVAHEIKNPLTSIRSAVDTLQRVKRPEDQAKLVEIVREDVRRLDRLITDISAASRLDAERARGKRERLDLGRLIATFAEHAQSTWGADKGLSIVLDTSQIKEGEPLVVEGHETRLAQVLDNLVGNARSFSPPNGHIWMRIKIE